MAEQVHKVVSTYFVDSLDSMLKCAHDHCPTVLSQTIVVRGDESEPISVEDDLRNACKEKNHMSTEFIHNAIVEQAGTDIVNRVKYYHEYSPYF